jgi:hypothetical protein
MLNSFKQIPFSNCDTKHEALGLLPFQGAQDGQRVIQRSSLFASNSGSSRGACRNGVLSRFDADLKLLRIKLKNRCSK